MIRVLEILEGDRAVVSTEGLFRVCLRPSDRIIGELMPKDDADDLVLACRGAGAHADSLAYASLAHMASS
jgi:hypothetical protein